MFQLILPSPRVGMDGLRDAKNTTRQTRRLWDQGLRRLCSATARALRPHSTSTPTSSISQPHCPPPLLPRDHETLSTERTADPDHHQPSHCGVPASTRDHEKACLGLVGNGVTALARSSSACSTKRHQLETSPITHTTQYECIQRSGCEVLRQGTSIPIYMNQRPLEEHPSHHSLTQARPTPQDGPLLWHLSDHYPPLGATVSLSPPSPSSASHVSSRRSSRSRISS